MPDSDDWMNDPAMQRAALTGWAQNPAVSTAERLAAALQVIEMYQVEHDQSEQHIKAGSPQGGQPMHASATAPNPTAEVR